MKREIAKHCRRVLSRLSARLIVLLVAVMMLPLFAEATHYVLFRDGRLYVFPTSSTRNMTMRYGQVKFTAIDGEVYSYPLSDIENISQTLNKSLPAMLTFGIDNKYNYQVVTDAEGVIGDTIHLDIIGIGKRLTPTFTISDSSAFVQVKGVDQQSNVTRMRFDEPKTYVVGYEGDMVLDAVGDGTYALRPFGSEYTVIANFLTDQSSAVPRIDINTVGGAAIASKEVYLDAEIIIDGNGVFPSMTDSVKVRGRGNTSWSSNPAAKNPYRLKFASKTKPLGLTKGKNWVLLANKIYGSMLTNAIGMKAASLIGTVAPNHIIPVDLYVNGKYKGNYNFTEKVGLHNNSVDLPDETVAAMMELDYYYNDPVGQKFRSNPQNIPVNVKDPEFGEDITVVTLDMIEERFNAFVAAVNNGDDLSEHVDMDALARYLMLNELICNKEIYHPKSIFCYYENVPQDSSKLVFGPVWDLDWGCGYLGGDPNSYFVQLVPYDFFNMTYTGEQYQFFSRLGKNKKLERRMFKLWEKFMEEGLDELCEFCLDYYEYAAPSLTQSRRAFADPVNYQEQASNAATWLRERATIIYNRRKFNLPPLGDVNGDGEVSVGDLTTLIDYLLSGNATLIDEDTADVDEDGTVSINDLTALIDLLLSNK